MFTDILGFFWLVLGVSGMIWPGFIKRRLGRKATRRFRRYMIAVFVTFFVFMLATFFRAEGFPIKILSLLGLAAGVKAIFSLSGRGSGVFLEWWSARPSIFFRVSSGIFFFMGVWLLFF